MTTEADFAARLQRIEAQPGNNLTKRHAGTLHPRQSRFETGVDFFEHLFSPKFALGAAAFVCFAIYALTPRTEAQIAADKAAHERKVRYNIYHAANVKPEDVAAVAQQRRADEIRDAEALAADRSR